MFVRGSVFPATILQLQYVNPSSGIPLPALLHLYKMVCLAITDGSKEFLRFGCNNFDVFCPFDLEL
jgi:hypothetical protein